MSSICVIGGTRFFGKIVVRDLLAQGHNVTILTRGNSSDDFGNTVHRLKADANNADQLRAALTGRTFDTVIHQMCYSPIAAKAASLAFDGRVGRLIMTSTIEVYNQDTFSTRKIPNISSFARETELDAESYGFDERLPWLAPDFAEDHYAEGKRQAEVVLAQTASFPVAFVRAAHVLSDQDEFTGRLRFHVDRILQGKPIKSWSKPGRTSFVYARDIAAFLAWACGSQFTGAVNACSPEGLNVYDVCDIIERIVGRKAQIEELPDPRGDDALSPFSYPRDFCMSTERANELGYQFVSVSEWLPQITESTVASARNLCSI